MRYGVAEGVVVAGFVTVMDGFHTTPGAPVILDWENEPVHPGGRLREIDIGVGLQFTLSLFLIESARVAEPPGRADIPGELAGVVVTVGGRRMHAPGAIETSTVTVLAV